MNIDRRGNKKGSNAGGGQKKKGRFLRNKLIRIPDIFEYKVFDAIEIWEQDDELVEQLLAERSEMAEKK